MSRVYFVGPDSLHSWLPYFRTDEDHDPVVRLGPAAVADVAELRALCRADGGRTAVFVSAHETLLRDRGLADELLSTGDAVFCQSHRATMLGVDKVVMKEFLRAEGFPTLPWWDARSGRRNGTHRLVVKARHGTQSQGIQLVPAGGHRPAADELCEPYRDGVEYSVVLYRDRDRLTLFPPVWKGATGPDLVPPWRRLRRCPPPQADPTLLARLCDVSARLAERAEVVGHLEVEFLVPPDGRSLVMEINPRVSGTVRLVAMATGVPIFSPDALPRGLTRLSAVRLAAEVPHDGPPICDPLSNVFATSRLTVAADDVTELEDKLRRNDADPRWLSQCAGSPVRRPKAAVATVPIAPEGEQ